jgi:hypothetical protein
MEETVLEKGWVVQCSNLTKSSETLKAFKKKVVGIVLATASSIKCRIEVNKGNCKHGKDLKNGKS